MVGTAFSSLFDWFNQPSLQEKGIHCVSFTKFTNEDIVRSGILRVIAEELERYRTANPIKH